MNIVQPITGVTVSDLYWKTLSVHRNTPHYQMLRKQVAELIQRKVSGLQTSHRDKPFTRKSGGALAGIWHMAISRNPDIVLFYTIAEDHICLAMLGSHQDYPNAGKNMSAANRTARKIRNSLEKGAAASPQWDRIDWKDIDFVLESTELHEASRTALGNLLLEVMQELETGARYEKRHGISCLALPEEEFLAYMEKLETLRSRCYEIMNMEPLTSREYLERVQEMALTP